MDTSVPKGLEGDDPKQAITPASTGNMESSEPRKEDKTNHEPVDSSSHGPLNLFSFLAASIRANQQEFGDVGELEQEEVEEGEEDEDEDEEGGEMDIAEEEHRTDDDDDDDDEQESDGDLEEATAIDLGRRDNSTANVLASIPFHTLSHDDNDDGDSLATAGTSQVTATKPEKQEASTEGLSSSTDSKSSESSPGTAPGAPTSVEPVEPTEYAEPAGRPKLKSSGHSTRSTHSIKRRLTTNLEASVQHIISRDKPKDCVLTQQPALHPKLRSELKDTRALALSDKLRKKIGLSNDEVLLGEYPCWLLKSILLQGSLYLTNKHLCFFAYLPRERAQVIMSGSLKKRSRKTASYNRFWFVLRQDSLSYFTSSSELYFPSGTIDLRYALRAEIVADKDKPKSESVTFTIVTETKSYLFKSDTPQSAQQWVTLLQKEIFRSRNEGDSVKIVIPLMNVIDVEQSTIVNVVVSMKIRAIEGDETFAVDEYVFAFFHRGDEAIKTIRESLKELGIPKVAIEDESDAGTSSPKYGSITEGITDSTETPPSHTNSSKNLAGLFKGHRQGLASSGRSHSQSGSRRGRESSRSSHLALSEIAGTAPPSRGRSRSPFFIREISEKLKSLGKDGPSRGVSPVNSPPTTPGAFNPSIPSASGEASPSSQTPDRPRSDEDKMSYDFLSNSESKEKLDSPPPAPADKPKNSYSVVSKVSEMWGGGRKHYPAERDEPLEPPADKDMVSVKEAIASNVRFRNHFSLGDADILVATYYCHLQKAVPLYGKLYLGNNYLCFRRLLPGTSLKMVLPISDIENVTKEKGFRFGYSGLVIVICGHEEIFLEFGSAENRDDCEIMILREMDRYKTHRINLFNGSQSPNLEGQGQNLNNGESQLFESHRRGVANSETLTAKWISRDDVNMEVPVLLSESGGGNNSTLIRAAAENYVSRPAPGSRFTLLTIGSRGDVQPYIALAKGLIAEGYVARIATHAEFGPWIEGHGIEFREIAGNPSDLMKIMIDHGKMSVSFLREATAKFRSWIDILLTSSWEACQGSDILIESPSAMAGIHIAEALQIPYFRAFTMPWTRTRAYPHAFMVPEQKMGGSYNYLTYVMFENILWKGIAHQVNKWRRQSLGIDTTNLDKLQQGSYPFLYCVSPTILVPPVDFGDWVRVTGYWFLDEGNDEYEPPKELVAFIKKAKDDGCKLVYIGFGSILVSDGKEFLNTIVGAVKKSGVRCILAKGWSDRLSDEESSSNVEIPPEIYSVESVPHDWLFPQMDAAVHHGGCGTTGASLRAGLPTIIKPYFADQFFYANRVEDLGVGVHLKKLSVHGLAKAIWEATSNERIISRAAKVGSAIREEDGVDVAIKTIYREIDYSFNLNKRKAEAAASGGASGGLLSAAASGLATATSKYGSIVPGTRRIKCLPLSGPHSPKSHSGRSSPVIEDSDSVSTQTEDNSWTMLDVRKHQ